jgi:hypothetical protein
MNSRDRETLFADFALTPAAHFRLHFFGAVLVCIEHAAASAESFDAALERFPFLIGYNNELAQRLSGMSAAEAFECWCAGLEAWEARCAEQHLPLRALRIALGADLAAMLCLVTIALGEEDGRFGMLFDALQGNVGQRHATVSLLRQCWSSRLHADDITSLLGRTRRLGLVDVLNPESPQQETGLQILSEAWEAIRGDEPGAVSKCAIFRPPDALMPLSDFIMAPPDRAPISVLPRLLERDDARVIIVRGPQHNGRRTALGAIARALGRGVLVLRGADKLDDQRWRETALLAVLRNAMPVVAFDLGPGETIELPGEWPARLPLGVALGRHGGVTGELLSRAVTLTFELPDSETRQRHWRVALPAETAAQIAHFSARYRLPAGQIHRVAQLARMRAALAGRAEPHETDVRDATCTLNRETLDALARRVAARGDWSRLAAGERTMRELEHLESRCRHRERLPAVLEGVTAGVRALFTGPSGTGKTHAARLLAARLQKDLYQLDLSAVVNKYIGETEKNLNRLFEAAEELDVVLLLDEGDALLTQRTEVQNANDRYANLETNFLLQRLESYQGILIITTNARTRIDSAFERRMDVIVEFHAPDADERWALWQMHLPEPSEVSPDFLGEVAGVCELTGGQIRNATLHAALLALDDGGVVRTAGVKAAVRREYLKEGGTCPLRYSAETY